MKRNGKINVLCNLPWFQVTLLLPDLSMWLLYDITSSDGDAGVLNVWFLHGSRRTVRKRIGGSALGDRKTTPRPGPQAGHPSVSTEKPDPGPLRIDSWKGHSQIGGAPRGGMATSMQVLRAQHPP